MTDNPAPQKNKGGAPRGNANALKHGFYSRRFKNADLTALEGLKDLDLTEEINLMRLAILRVIEQSSEATTLRDSLDVVRTLSEGASTLTRLVRAQKLLIAEENDIGAALNRALEQVTREMDLKP